ncbi:MAG TPA: OadG-related small transporter subunit [Chloroflexota bacterium]|nr:OadG-related small transporter subunit [Chloroflexota bacterium]
MSEPWAVGSVLAALGMGGTLFTLGLLSLLTALLKRLFPHAPGREP